MGRLLIQFAGTNTTKALSETLSKNVIIVDEDLHQLRLHDGVTPGGHIIGQSSGGGVPIGTIIPFAGDGVPEGYLICDGSAISRTTYASLFAVIGTIYGIGDGSSTFNLPNYSGAYPICGVISVSSLRVVGNPFDAELPNITGNFGMTNPGPVPYVMRFTTGSGALRGSGTQSQAKGPTTSEVGTGYPTMSFDASRSHSAYSRSDNIVLPTRVSMRFFIKYI